jgi:hypothetical protein
MGIDPPPDSLENIANPARGGAESGAPALQIADPDLARVIEVWPTLPAHLRAAVLALVTPGSLSHPSRKNELML